MCSTCTNVAGNLADDDALETELKKLVVADQAVFGDIGAKIETKQGSAGSPVASSALGVPGTDNEGLFGYNTDGTEIYVRFHSDEVALINPKLIASNLGTGKDANKNGVIAAANSNAGTN